MAQTVLQSANTFITKYEEKQNLWVTLKLDDASCKLRLNFVYEIPFSHNISFRSLCMVVIARLLCDVTNLGEGGEIKRKQHSGVSLL